MIETKKKYVGDNLIIFYHTKRNAKHILNKMNSLHCNLKFKLMNDHQQGVRYFAPSNN
jgi:hypothetical protein